jgi:hypothetical protein
MSESLIPSVIAIVGAGLAALGVRAWFQLSAYRRARRKIRPDQECLLERYQPMARLLAGGDADFLRHNASCPKVATRWDRSRRRVARLYLRELAADFHRLHAKARALVAESPEQYAALVPLLLRQQFVFRRTLVMIEVRLALGGLSVTQTSVEKLLGSIEAMQREISRVAATSPA